MARLTAVPSTLKKPSTALLPFRKDFPILQQEIYGKPLVYLDNAASTQKPKEVIQTIQEYYERYNANIHRGVHYLSQKATDLYEGAREEVRHFINASKIQEIIYTRGTTESINLVAHSFVRNRLRPNDEILISAMEHHSNIVPWQILCEETGAKLRIIPMNEQGELRLDSYATLLSEKTKFLSLVHVSNALGTINPIRKMIQMAHQHQVPVLIDGAQAVSHLPVDVQQLDCDFYAFSGHKLFAPTGIGILYGKSTLLEKMKPYQSGGDMIRSVSFEKTTYNDLPYRFEAGTPHIEGGIGLGAAIRYIQKIGLSTIQAYEQELLEYATRALNGVPGIRFVGTAQEKASVLSFTLNEIHPHDIGTILDQEGIAIRTGHHCAQPVMHFFRIPATARASLAFYNTPDDIDALVQGLHKVLEVFA
ncbi:MAG: cysteine desulfurase [Planctomycetota bacterium]